MSSVSLTLKTLFSKCFTLPSIFCDEGILCSPVGFARITSNIVCTLYEDYFACMDKREKKRYLFDYSDIDKILFANRLEALTLVTDAEKDKPKVSNERFYEED